MAGSNPAACYHSRCNVASDLSAIVAAAAQSLGIPTSLPVVYQYDAGGSSLSRQRTLTQPEDRGDAVIVGIRGNWASSGYGDGETQSKIRLTSGGREVLRDAPAAAVSTFDDGGGVSPRLPAPIYWDEGSSLTISVDRVSVAGALPAAFALHVIWVPAGAARQLATVLPELRGVGMTVTSQNTSGKDEMLPPSGMAARRVYFSPSLARDDDLLRGSATLDSERLFDGSVTPDGFGTPNAPDANPVCVNTDIGPQARLRLSLEFSATSDTTYQIGVFGVASAAAVTKPVRRDDALRDRMRGAILMRGSA